MTIEHASKLKAARERKGLTQTQLAKLAGVSQGTIGNIEAGTRGYGASVVRIAKVLDVTPEYLTSNDGELHPTPQVSESVRLLTYVPQQPLTNDAEMTFAGTVFPSRIKVVGMAKLDDDGFFDEMPADNPAASGTVSAISEDPTAYAMCISGDAGFPAIRDGEYIVVEPSIAPGPTDRVVIALRDGRTMLQELIVDKGDSITVVCLDGSNRRTIQRADIREEFGIQTVTHIVSQRKWEAEPPPE